MSRTRNYRVVSEPGNPDAIAIQAEATGKPIPDLRHGTHTFTPSPSTRELLEQIKRLEKRIAALEKR